MPRLTASLLCVCLVTFLQSSQSIARAEAEFQPLFDGTTLDAFEQHGGTAKYTIEDGVIVGTSVPKTSNSFLCTKKLYGDFILELDFKVDPQLNSGVQFRSEFFAEPTEVSTGDGKTRKVDADRVHGYQFEIDCNPQQNRWWAGGVYDEARRGWLFPGSKGGDPKEFTNQGREITKQEDWNHLRVEAVGDSIKTYLNGELRTDFIDDLTPRGVIALQVHGVGNDESKVGKQVRWRNLQIKDLSSK